MKSLLQALQERFLLLLREGSPVKRIGNEVMTLLEIRQTIRTPGSWEKVIHVSAPGERYRDLENLGLVVKWRGRPGGRPRRLL